jgi:xanthine dehydrogenase accessory factor
VKLALLAAFNAERAARRPAALLTDLVTGEARFFQASDLQDEAALNAAGGHDLVEAVTSGTSRAITFEGRSLFATVSRPSLRVVVLGAVHMSQAMVPLCALLSLDLTIIDPRTAFATPERFAGVKLLAEWPDEALPRVGLDADTAFIALTHDPKIDDPGLIAALTSGCFYVGALGSRKTHARRVERLAEAGMSMDALSRIRAPIGLDIGAKSPEEIAVSIISEVISVRRKGNAT